MTVLHYVIMFVFTSSYAVISPHMACRVLILMTTSAKMGPGMPGKYMASALVVYQSSVSLLPAFFKFFFRAALI